MAKKNKQIKINPYVLVILSFILVIFVGSILLNMPFARKDHTWSWGNYLDSLTTAVSATCVTGTCTYIDGFADTITFGGQVVTAVLIQIGGLGFITVLTFIITLFKSKLQFKDRYLISQMVSSTNFADVVKFVRKIILISFICEFAGFLMGLPVFLYMYPNDLGQALWNSLFHSISAFNNAGFDLFGNVTSLIDGLSGATGATNWVFIGPHEWRYIYFCSYVMLLILLGGISFLVIIEVATKLAKHSQWRAFTKIAILMGLILHLGGALSIWLGDGFKGENSVNFFHCLFQSITCRTAGFSTKWQDNFSTSSKVISSLLMIIGGAPLGTAGGLKTTTFFMVILAMISHFKGKKVHAFHREYSNNMVVKAMSLLFLGLVIIVISYIAIDAFGLEKAGRFTDYGYAGTLESITYDFDVDGTREIHLHTDLSMLYFYEICSNFGTTGFFVGIEPFLSVGSKIVINLLMFLGRLGPMTFLQVIQTNMDKDVKQNFEYVEEDFLIG